MSHIDPKPDLKRSFHSRAAAFLSTSRRRPGSEQENRDVTSPELRKVQPPLRAALFDAASDQERNRETFHGAIGQQRALVTSMLYMY